MRRNTAFVVSAVAIWVVAVAPSALASSSQVTLMRNVGAAAAAVAIILLGILFMGPGKGTGKDLRGRLGSYAGPADGRGLLARLPFARRFAQEAEDVAQRRGLLTAINGLLERADIPLRAGEAVLVALIASLILGGIAGLYTQSLVVMVAVIVGGVVVMVMGIQAVASRERWRFEGQLPDTLNLLATSLRAGYSLLQAVEAVSVEAPDPTAREFGRAISEIRLGQPVAEAMRGVADRMGSDDFDWAVMAIDIQREVGGNLAEVLTIASDTLLQRNRLRRDVRAMTAEGRISAVVLAVIPFFMFGFLWTSNREYLDPLIETSAGIASLIVAGVVMLAGIYWLRKIVDIEI